MKPDLFMETLHDVPILDWFFKWLFTNSSRFTKIKCDSIKQKHVQSDKKIQAIPEIFKDDLWGLRQFLATESSLKMMKNAFSFTTKALFVLKI